MITSSGMEEFDSPKLTEEKINQILSTTFKSGYHFPEKSDDELIYRELK